MKRKGLFRILHLLIFLSLFGLSGSLFAQNPLYTTGYFARVNNTWTAPCGNPPFDTTDQLTGALANLTASYGGTIDLNCYETNITVTADVFSPVTVPVVMFLPEHTVTVNANATIGSNFEICSGPGGSIVAGAGYTLTNNALPCLGSGVGSVTSVGLQTPTDILGVTSSTTNPITSSGIFTIFKEPQATGYVFAGPAATGTSGASIVQSAACQNQSTGATASINCPLPGGTTAGNSIVLIDDFYWPTGDSPTLTAAVTGSDAGLTVHADGSGGLCGGIASGPCLGVWHSAPLVNGGANGMSLTISGGVTSFVTQVIVMEVTSAPLTLDAINLPLSSTATVTTNYSNDLLIGFAGCWECSSSSTYPVGVGPSTGFSIPLNADDFYDCTGSSCVQTGNYGFFASVQNWPTASSASFTFTTNGGQANGGMIAFKTTSTGPTSGIPFFRPPVLADLPAAPVYSLLGNDTGSVGVPAYISMDTLFGSCSGASNALTYSTSTHAFGCNTISAGSAAWSALTNATAGLTLANAGYATTFDQTSAVNWTWANTTAATSTTAQSSPILRECGQGWEGSTPANTTDCWTIQNVIQNGANPSSPSNTLTFGNTGSSTGGYSVEFLPSKGGFNIFQKFSSGAVLTYLTPDYGAIGGTGDQFAIQGPQNNGPELLWSYSSGLSAWILATPNTILDDNSGNSKFVTITASGALFKGTEGTCSGAASGVDVLCAASGHYFETSLNNGSFFVVPQESSTSPTAGGLLYANSTFPEITASADFTNSSHTIAGGTSAILDLHAATGTAAFLVPSNSSETATAAASIDFDTTSKNYHVYANGADSIMAASATSLSPTSGHCVDWVVVSGNILLGDAGAACGTGGGISFPQTVSGTTTSGGIPYFSSTTTLTSSAVLALGQVLLGGGAGGAPTSDANLDDGQTTANTLTYASSGGITASAGPLTAAGSVGLFKGTEGTCSGAASGIDVLCAASGHYFETSLNNGSFFVLPQESSTSPTAGGLLYANSTFPEITASADFTNSSHTIAGGANAILDLSAATGTAAFKVPSNSSNTASAAAAIDFDTTNKNYHVYANGGDSIMAASATSLSPTNGHCVDWLVSSGNLLLGDAGAACGTGTVTDGSGSTTANQLALATATAHIIGYATTLPTAAMPALTGDVTNSAGSLATTVSKTNGGNTLAGTSLTQYDVYYMSSSGLALAEANASGTVPAICVAATTSACQFNGLLTDTSWSWTEGQVLYLSDSTAGTLTATAPSTSGHFVQRVAVAVSSTQILIDPSLDVGTIQ